MALIREDDLLDAIAECQGDKNPNANTCIKLAAYYTILDHIKSKAETTDTYSFDSKPADVVIYGGGSEFAEVIRGQDVDSVLKIIDELMDTLQALVPRLYDVTMSRLRG